MDAIDRIFIWRRLRFQARSYFRKKGVSQFDKESSSAAVQDE